jgi:hypothetical protein
MEYPLDESSHQKFVHFLSDGLALFFVESA